MQQSMLISRHFYDSAIVEYVCIINATKNAYNFSSVWEFRTVTFVINAWVHIESLQYY